MRTFNFIKGENFEYALQQAQKSLVKTILSKPEVIHENKSDSRTTVA